MFDRVVTLNVPAFNQENIPFMLRQLAQEIEDGLIEPLESMVCLGLPIDKECSPFRMECGKELSIRSLTTMMFITAVNLAVNK